MDIMTRLRMHGAIPPLPMVWCLVEHRICPQGTVLTTWSA